MDSISLILSPEPQQTRLLMTCGPNEVLRAILCSHKEAHPRAATTLLEGLSLFYQRPLSVVLCVDNMSDSSALDLCDGLGFGQRTLHYDIGIAVREHQKTGSRISGLGSFRELKRFCRPEVIR